MKCLVRSAMLVIAMALIGVIRPAGAQEAGGERRRDEAPAQRLLELENAELKRTIQSQRAKIEALERELARLKTQRVPQLPGTPPAPPGPGWIEREFNGLKYYVVPLKPESKTR